MTPLFAFTADWHVSRTAWVDSGIEGDAYHALRQVVDHCVATQLPLVAAGDLFDTKDPRPSDTGCVRTQLDKMRKARLPVYYTQGQHERQTLMTWMAGIHNWPVHIHGKAVDVPGKPGVRLYGLDWQSTTRLPAALAAIPAGVDALVCHQVWRNLMGEDRLVVECEGRFEDVPRVPLILTGDFHKHTMYKFGRDDGTVAVALSPGPISMRDIGEDPGKHFYVVGRDADGDLAWQSVPIYGRYCAKYEAMTADALDRLLVDELSCLDAVVAETVARCKALPPELHRPIVRVTFAEDIPEARSRIAAACGAKYHLFYDPVPKAAAVDDVDQKAVMRALKARGMLGVLDEMDLGGSPDVAEVKAAVVAMLAADDPAEVLAEICGG